MNENRTSILSTMSTILLIVAGAVNPSLGTAWRTPPSPIAQTQPAAAGRTRHVGTVKAINGTTITLTAEAGAVITVTLEDATRLLRIPPGDTNPKDATPLDFKDLQVGDLIRVVGLASNDGKSMAASSIIALKATDVAAKHQQELQDWQKRGMGGLVSAVDPAAGTVTISIRNLMGKKSIVIHTSKDTVIRRYAPDSVKFEDAKTSSLQEIKPGDQLRARGDRSADGTELTAEEIVTGVFRNIMGTINSVDASSGEITVQDLLSKKPVMVKVAATSELHKVSLEAGQRFAMQFNGASGIAGLPGGAGAGSGAASSVAPNSGALNSGAAGASSGAASGGNPPAGATRGGAANSQGPPGGGSAAAASRGGSGAGTGGSGAGARPAGGLDFQQMLMRQPTIVVADLHKGDAVVILATEGTPTSPSTVITLGGGVEQILQAAPSASQAMTLAPWSLGGAPAGGEGP
jgi:Domain of unknown function (DUF5666)